MNWKAYKARVIYGGIISAIGLFPLIKAGARGLPGLIVLFLPGFLLGIWGLKSGLKDYNEWKQYRDKHMENGICCKGKVVDWGGHKYWKSNPHITRENGRHGRSLSYLTRESDWWIEVEYIDSRDGLEKRFRAKDMNKKGKYLMGKRADVYLYQNHVYINVP